jgi:hypothetical protein
MNPTILSHLDKQVSRGCRLAVACLMKPTDRLVRLWMTYLQREAGTVGKNLA